MEKYQNQNFLGKNEKTLKKAISYQIPSNMP